MKYFKRNSAAEKIFGYSKEEILCKEITLLMPERFRKAHQTGEKAGIKNPNPRLQHINPHIFRHSIYSHRKAIIGSIFDALNAGQKRK